MVTLALMGDVMLGRGVNDEIPRRSPEAFWGDVLPLLRSADAAIANLECAITRHARPWGRTPKVFHFRADPAAVEVLAAGNVRVVSLANNHSLDFEEVGLLETLRHLDEAGISHAGAGRHEREALRPTMLNVGDVKVAMAALTDNEPPFAAGPDRPGTAYLDIAHDLTGLRRVEAQVASARQQGADLVILSLHWGPNMLTTPPPEFQAFARAAIERGVDLIHGHSAHVFQAIERHGKGLILYDTGDFLDDYAVDPEVRNDWSFLFLLELAEKRLHRLRLVPVRLTYAQVNRAKAGEFEAIRTRMRERCAPFRTALATTPEGLALSLDSSDDQEASGERAVHATSPGRNRSP